MLILLFLVFFQIIKTKSFITMSMHRCAHLRQLPVHTRTSFVTMIWLCILPALFLQTYQISDPNCLRSNPQILDAEFSLFNRYENISYLTEEDFVKHVALFTTRFKQGHEVRGFSWVMLRLIAKSVSLFNTTTNHLQIFIKATHNFNLGLDLDAMIHLYKMDYEAIMKINSGNRGQVVVGLYSPSAMHDYDDELKAMNSAFGSKDTATLQTGHEFFDCFKPFRSSKALGYLQRLHFFSCRIEPVTKGSPEETAEDVIRTCDSLRDTAYSLNVTAKVMCSVGYPSFGMTKNGLIGSLSDFQRFWCRIVAEIKMNPSHAQIIMRSAFDDTPINYRDDREHLYSSIYHEGWWRRRLVTSYEVGAFVEKVEELEEGRETGNCIRECQICSSSNQCCHERDCYADSSFQPFEQGTPQNVCQLTHTKCAPRPPKSSVAKTQPNLHAVTCFSAVNVVNPVEMAFHVLLSISLFVINRRATLILT